jgi:hypothetical protein
MEKKAEDPPTFLEAKIGGAANFIELDINTAQYSDANKDYNDIREISGITAESYHGLEPS